LFLPRLFINSSSTTASDLALFLSGSEAAAGRASAEIIAQRPAGGYSSWDDVPKFVPAVELEDDLKDLVVFD
jgi:hypothetical protein